MKKLTERQEEVLNFIKVFISTNKYPPTMREIAFSFNITANGAYDHVKALEKKGKIHCDVNRRPAFPGNDAIVGTSGCFHLTNTLFR